MALDPRLTASPDPQPDPSDFLSAADKRTAFAPKRVKGGWHVKGETLDCNWLTALLFGFQHADSPEEKEFLFWEIADDLWNKDLPPEDHEFARHKWSWLVIHHACREKYLAIGGAGGSGKSYTMAGWAWVNFLADPKNTMVLVTSTDLKGARGRVWGCIMRLGKSLESKGIDLPCDFRDSVGSIVYRDDVGTSDLAGIKLVAADKSQSKDKVGKMIGVHNKNVLLIADELSDISENVQTAFTGNLVNNPHSQMIGMSNPGSRFNPFGIFATPKGGWEAVNTTLDYEWPTALGGRYIRLDSEQSPNIDQDGLEGCYDGGIFYPYLPTQASIDNALESLGATPEEARKSRNFMRFQKAVFFDSDDDDTVFTEPELMRAGALNRTKLVNPELIAGLDPSFSSGGDKTVLTFAEIGWDHYGQFCVQHKEIVYIYEDVTNKIDPRELQISNKVKLECEKRGLKVENLAVDASGPGSPFCGMLQLQWARGFLRVEFGGAASDMRVRNDSKLTGKDKFKNRASELFFIGKQFLLGRQFYGIPSIVAKQMCERICLEPTKGQHGLIMQVEPKKAFRARKGYSPDETDSFLVLVELARQKFSFRPTDPLTERKDEDNIAAWLGQGRTMRGLDPCAMGHVAGLAG